jgi:predicted kinase
MEAIILIGGQASGKSTFYKERFFLSHVRINLDMLRTRHREARMLETCIATGQPFVVDNTNPTRSDRERYVSAAQAAGFRVIGYYFQSRLAEAMTRNAARSARERIPDAGLRNTYGRMEIPELGEGFDELYYVRITDTNTFVVEDWNDGHRGA